MTENTIDYLMSLALSIALSASLEFSLGALDNHSRELELTAEMLDARNMPDVEVRGCWRTR